jgi:SpoVK/Ycf46/Vps4 family AAA+-type ATPase
LTFAPSIDLDVIASDTEGFSGADLQAMVYNAHLEVVHESINASERKASQPTGEEAEGGRGKGKSTGKGKGKVNGDSNGDVAAPTKSGDKAWKQVAPAQDGFSVFDKQSKAMTERVSATKRTRSTQLIDGQMDGLFANLERTSEQEGRVASAPVVVSCTPLIG